MKIEPAMSARKSSQKKQRKARDREVGRALAAADAAAAAVAAGGGDSAGITAGDGGGGAAVGWNRNGGGSADVELREAACGALSCLSQVVLTCGAYLPMSPRLAVEDLLHRGLGVLVRAGVRGRSCGGGGGAAYRGRGVGPAGCLPLEDPRVAREFVTLAQACLVTPLVSVSSICIIYLRCFWNMYWSVSVRAPPAR